MTVRIELEFSKEDDKLFAYAFGDGIEPLLGWICSSGGGVVDAVIWAKDRQSATSYYPCRVAERRFLALPIEERKKIVDKMRIKTEVE